MQGTQYQPAHTTLRYTACTYCTRLLCHDINVFARHVALSSSSLTAAHDKHVEFDNSLKPYCIGYLLPNVYVPSNLANLANLANWKGQSANWQIGQPFCKQRCKICQLSRNLSSLQIMPTNFISQHENFQYWQTAIRNPDHSHIGDYIS